MRGAAAATVFTRLLTFGLGAITAVWTARALGPYGRGVWSVGLLIASIVGLLTESGVGQAALFVVGKRPDRRRAVVHSGLLLVGISGFLWTSFVVLWAVQGSNPLSGFPRRVFVIAALAGYAAGIVLITRQLLAVLGDWDSMNRSVVLQPLTLLAALFPAFLVFVPSPSGALIAFAASFLITAAFGLNRLRSLDLAGPAVETGIAPSLVSYGLRSQITTIALTLTYRSDLLLVNHFLGVAQTGVYSVALTLSEIVRVVAEAAQVLVVTQAATTDDVRNHAQAIARRSAVLTLIAAMAMAGVSGVLVPLVFGVSFTGAVNALWCLVPGSVALALSYSLSPLLVLKGQVLMNGAAAVLGLGILWTVGSWGPGAPSLIKFALASSLAYWSIALAQIIWLWHSRSLDPAGLVPTSEDVQDLVRACWRAARRSGLTAGNGSQRSSG